MRIEKENIVKISKELRILRITHKYYRQSANSRIGRGVETNDCLRNWESCDGNNAMVDVLKKHTVNAIATDLFTKE